MNDDDDHSFFMSEMKRVVPLSQKHKACLPPEPKKIANKLRENYVDEHVDPSYGFPLNTWVLEEAISSNKPIEHQFHSAIHLSKKDKRQLSQASKKIKMTLDLHGATLENAWNMTLAYIDDLYHNGRQYGLIVHGKGHYSQDGVARLKIMLTTHLPQHPKVLAFHSALPKDGGTGALYIRIRQKKEG